jgi:hypothetical protein
MYGLLGGRLLKKLLGVREESPVDAPAAETENLSHSLEEGSAKSEHRQAEQTEDKEEHSADEGKAKS